jgi:hypothetical protein
MSSTLDGTLRPYYRDNLWLSIEDMPIWNWQKIVEENNLIYLFKNHKKKKLSNQLILVWEDLQQQYMDEFGIDESLLLRVKTMRKIISLNIKYFERKDRSLLNFIKIEENRLKEAQQYNGVKFYKTLDSVSSAKGFRINPKEFTVIEWGHALKNMATQQHGKDIKGA